MELLKPKIPFLSVSGIQRSKYSGKEYKKRGKYEKWSFPWYSLLIVSAILGLAEPQSASISLLYPHGSMLH